MTSYDSQWIPMGSKSCLWHPMAPHDPIWPLMASYGSLWLQIVTVYASLWHPLALYCFRWLPLTPYDFYSSNCFQDDQRNGFTFKIKLIYIVIRGYSFDLYLQVWECLRLPMVFHLHNKIHLTSCDSLCLFLVSKVSLLFIESPWLHCIGFTITKVPEKNDLIY